ncbi:NVEALA domain-containing protein [Bacteroides sp. UBA939]|uniref:NVEALA domain-containing protein n=1 Tax=Bacteroides sp. UBA939 TaxID=1946092 RepID=UPI0025C24086|nr:NVEALA domain-containing protein [Bacteroides sp. UBA939]
MRSRAFIFSLLMVVAVVSLWSFKSQKKIDGLMLKNVEALAAGEAVVPLHCMGTGTVDCPMGGKVRMVVTGYSFEVPY